MFGKSHDKSLLYGNEPVCAPTVKHLSESADRQLGSSTRKVRPMRSRQVAAGIYTELPRHIRLNVEGYYRTTSQLLEYDGGNSLMLLPITGTIWLKPAKESLTAWNCHWHTKTVTMSLKQDIHFHGACKSLLIFIPASIPASSTTGIS